ncbi:MAG: PBSX family phage terminase large subunit [Ruminococcaceae bacterium]|nr:PBSX family phage terminase large subunit [Oscillospiraceae bacterium]
MIYTEKQRDLMRLWQRNELKRINLLEGSVSGGKTWISLVLWGFWVATMPKDKLYLMCAKSITTLKRNCLMPLEELVGSKNFTYSTSAKEGKLFGRTILLEGANDARSESKIRGLSLQGAYCDELTQFPEDFFAMLLSRLRISGAKLIATTNPDKPSHWLKTKYIDRAGELDFLDMKFLIDDNTTLDPEYIKNIKCEYTGVFYDRFIKGEWKAAEGAIYKDFADAPQKYLLDAPPDDIAFCTLGMDFGGNGSAHAIVCTGYSRGLKKVVAVDEYYRKEVISPLQLERDTVDFVRRCKSKYKIADMYCDSAEQVLIKGIKGALAREKIPINVHNARKGAIIDRIRFTTSIMAMGRFFVVKNCKHLTEAFSSAVWDGKKLDDTRLDDGSINIDSLDAFEYSIEPYMKDILNLNFNRRD